MEERAIRILKIITQRGAMILSVTVTDDSSSSGNMTILNTKAKGFRAGVVAFAVTIVAFAALIPIFGLLFGLLVGLTVGLALFVVVYIVLFVLGGCDITMNCKKAIGVSTIALVALGIVCVVLFTPKIPCVQKTSFVSARVSTINGFGLDMTFDFTVVNKNYFGLKVDTVDGTAFYKGNPLGKAMTPIGVTIAQRNISVVPGTLAVSASTSSTVAVATLGADCIGTFLGGTISIDIDLVAYEFF
jgi:hypothetical protein